MAYNTTRDQKDIVELFESEYTRSEDKYSAVKKAYQEDNDFSLGDQWDTVIRNNRQVQGKERPCLTINKIDPLVHRIVNSAKQQKLESKVKPVDDKSDPDTAEIFAGLIRNTEYVSKAVRAYMWAYECAVRGGVGYFRIVNEYEEDSFDQCVRIKRIRNPMCVSFDADSEDQSGADATIAIMSDEISKKKADLICKNVGYDTSKIIPDRKIWFSADDGVRHAEMYWQECEDDELIELTDLSVVKKSEIAAEAYEMIKSRQLIRRTRPIQSKKIKYANLCGSQVIETLDTNSRYVPIIRVVGREGYISGKVDYRGITRNSMDSNRMYNVMSSLLVERVGLAPRAPVVGAAGQFDGYEDQWNNANNENFAKLEYNPVSIAGTLAPPPQRYEASSGDPTIERYMMISSNDIKDTSNLGDAYMGNKSNETSSVAIKARAAQSDLATYDLQENITDSIEHGARIQLDMLPRIMSDRQVVRIMGEDYTQKVINLKMFKDKDGNTKPIDLSVGKFDTEVVVSSGDKTRRETAIEQLSFVLQTNPEAASLIMDIFVGNLDIKDAQKVAKRFKALLPPQVIAAENETEKDNPELEAFQQYAEGIIEKLKGQLEEAVAKLQEAELMVKNKEGELQIKEGELKLKEREVDIKEWETHKKLKMEQDSGDKEVKDKKDGSETMDYLIAVVQDLRKQMGIMATVIEKIAPQGIAQPAEAPTEGSGLPAAQDANVGVT